MLSLFPISVSFPLTPLESVEGVSLTCVKKLGGIDTSRIILNLTPDVANKYISAGSPFRAIWYARGRQDECIGYIHSFRPHNEGYLQKTLIIGTGTAYPLFNEPGRTYYKTAIHHVAEDICEDNRFQLEVDPHPLVQEQILQQNESDWTFLNRLAEQWGYVFMMDRVTMIFRSMNNVLKENYRRATLESTGSIPAGESSNLKSFKPSFSALNKVPYAKSVGAALDPITINRVFWEEPESEDSIFQQVITNYPSSSEQEGELLGIGQSAKSRFRYTADAVLQSPVGIKPMDVYQILHEGQRMTWVVHSIKHIIDGKGGYTGEVVFGTDGKDYVTDASRRQVDVETLINMSRSKNRSEPVIINTRPYFSGMGASVAVKDQRWCAMTVDGRTGRRSA